MTLDVTRIKKITDEEAKVHTVKYHQNKANQNHFRRKREENCQFKQYEAAGNFSQHAALGKGSKDN